jgi:hypothetical protein
MVGFPSITQLFKEQIYHLITTMLRSSVAVHFSLSPNAVSAPRPLQNKLRRRTSTQVRSRPNTPDQPCVSLKRKLIVTWKKITQAVRPAVRQSFIPPGFILVARPHSLLWSSKKKKSREEVADMREEESVKAHGERLKSAFCFWG